MGRKSFEPWKALCVVLRLPSFGKNKPLRKNGHKSYATRDLPQATFSRSLWTMIRSWEIGYLLATLRGIRCVVFRTPGPRTGLGPGFLKERETGFEPATASLEGWNSTN